jgi:hypothetical protein
MISANEKFKEFKANDNFYSILFVIWDDFIYEPISALIGKPSGLFLEESFAKDNNGKRKKFPFVDAVFLDRHLIQIMNATQDKNLLDGKKHAMDYGHYNEFPYKVVIPNPDSFLSDKIPNEVFECFQIHKISPELGAEYVPSDIILWS